MQLFTTDAIVIKSIKYAEADRIITFFTKDFGKIQGIAKASRRTKSKFGASLELLTHSKLFFFGKENTNIYRINSCDIVKSFRKNREEYDCLTRSIYMVDAINTLTTIQTPQPTLFNFLINSLTSLGELENLDKMETRINIFSLQLLKHIGYAPTLSECIFCENPSNKIVGFNIQKGGTVCQYCMKKNDRSFKISLGILNFMKCVSKNRGQILKRLTTNATENKEIRNLINSFLYAHTQKKIKSSEYF